jgi:hypothetical protein
MEFKYMQQNMHVKDIPLAGPIKVLHTHVPSAVLKTIATTEVYARKGALTGLESDDVKFLHDILLQDDVSSQTQLCVDNFKNRLDDFKNSLAILQKNSLSEEEHCVLAELKNHVLQAVAA